MKRREFVKRAVLLGAALTAGALPGPVEAGRRRPGFRVELDVIEEGYDGKFCWFHPRAGTVPGKSPKVVLVLQRWLTARSDVFYPMHSQFSGDCGQNWSRPVEQAGFAWRKEAGDVVVGVCDFTPKWHAKSGRLIGTASTVRYLNDKFVATSPREPAWSVYDPATESWEPWRVLEMPKGDKFWNSGAGCAQRVDLKNGEILLPIHFTVKGAPTTSCTVVRCAFDGKTLRYLEHGSEFTVPIPRGLCEPSLTVLDGRYYLTLRNDEAAYVTSGKDGLHFPAPKRWTWDDGTELGSYNTQAHWVTHDSGLFLVYTRRNANNDNVVRHRAPLFMAQVDPKRLVILRDTEIELVPNKGAQLGNFGIVDVNENETWITTSEGMGRHTDPKFGANGRVYAAKLIWNKPNKGWNSR